jgi:hypothetical protein
MTSDIDEQPPSRPARRPPPARRRAPARPYQGGRRPPPPPPAEPPPPGDGPSGPSSSRKTVTLLAVATVAVLALVVLAFVLTSGKSTKRPAANPPTSGSIPVTNFRDDQTGFSIQYPRGWEKVAVPDATYRLVLDAGNNVGMILRVFETETATTAANLENIKAVTDGLVTSNETVKVVKQQAVTLNGLVGYYYLYTLKDDAGLDAVHAHYFLFQGHKMNMIVFQASPDDFQRLAPTFDQIVESFRSDPDNRPAVLPSASTTTTTSG